MNKRLLFITPIFPKSINEDHVVPFISQFTQRFENDTSVQIDVISLMYPFCNHKYSFGNITVHPIGSNFVSNYRKIPFLFKAILKGFQLFKQHKYDGVLCFWYRESALVGRILNLLLNVKQVVWMHGQDVKSDNKYLRLLKISAKNIVMISAHQKKYFLENCHINVDKIANVAIDKNKFPPLNTNVRSIDIIGIGNLYDLKNYSLFIDIISELHYKNLKILIIGEGKEQESLQKKVHALGLSTSLSFAGLLPHHEVLNHLNNSKIFLHTSKFEGAGVVIQEALYSGCKVVSTIELQKNFDSDDSFYFNTNQANLIKKINYLLQQKLVANRIENFSMEDSIQIIYDMFYKD